MEGLLAALLGLSFPVGIFVSQNVFRIRAGLTKRRTGVDWREFLLPNLGFFLLVVLKSLVWPIVLLFWLFSGMPPSRWRAVTSEGGIEQRRVVRQSPIPQRQQPPATPPADRGPSLNTAARTAEAVNVQPDSPSLEEIYAAPSRGNRGYLERREAALRENTSYIWDICRQSGQLPLAIFYAEGTNLVAGGLLVVTSGETLHFNEGRLRRVAHSPGTETTIGGGRSASSTYFEVTVRGAEGTLSYAAETLSDAQRICGVIDFWVDEPGMRADPRVWVTAHRVEIPDAFFVDTLRAAGYRVTSTNMRSVHERFGMMFIGKARKYIDSTHGVAAGERFTQRYGRPDDHLLPVWATSVLRGWIDLDPDAAYLAACVPHSIKSFLLQTARENGGYLSTPLAPLKMWESQRYENGGSGPRRVGHEPGRPPIIA